MLGYRPKRSRVGVFFFIVFVFGWLIWVTWTLVEAPISFSSVMGDRKVVTIHEKGKYYYVLSEKSVRDGAIITDSKGKTHYLMSQEQLRALGHKMIQGGATPEKGIDD